MNDYEARRLENIKRNRALIADLGLQRHGAQHSQQQQRRSKVSKTSKRPGPTRASARIASVVAAAASQPSYNEDTSDSDTHTSTSTRRRGGRSARQRQQQNNLPSPPASDSSAARDARLPSNPTEAHVQWTSWTPAAPAPSRDAASGRFHFVSHPTFQPNKSPEEVLREGAFGGSYFRELYSRNLGFSVSDDWRELPAAWTAGLAPARVLAAPVYDPQVNKFQVACGQSIEEWEAAGWIDHAHDVRGWFQWYCRFFMGRRCPDDERQVGRWRKCVGDSGRWRRLLLKKYVALGVRHVFDDGELPDDEAPQVSPVIHQTCHHWAFEVRQDTLDEFWRTAA